MIMRNVLSTIGLVVALTISGAVTPVIAQQSDVISDIQISGNSRIERETILRYMPVRAGDSVDENQLDQIVRNLFGTGLFDDVNVDQSGGVLSVSVVENPIINQISFEGNKQIDDELLAGEIQLRQRVVYTRGKVQSAVERIVEIYQRSGRFAATVEPKVIERPQNRVDLVFEINEGERTGVSNIIFLGNEVFSDSTLRGAILTTESAFWRILTDNDSYDADRLEFDKELLRRYYLERGYADFNVRSAIAELTPDGSSFFITFSVDEGEKYDFGEVNVSASIPDLDDSLLQGDVLTRSGEVFNASMMERSALQLTETVGTLGYAFGRIEPQTQINADTRTVDVNYVIDEGERVFIERINIFGNLRTLDEVIRREMRLSEGDAFNTVLLRRSEQRIRNLGFFESVQVRDVEGSTPDRVIIEIEVVEQSTGEISFGAGFSTSDGVLGDIRLNERNLLGKGQDLALRATFSGRRQEFNLSFTEPYFLQRDLAAGFDIFHRTTDFQSESSFDERNTGVTLRTSYPLTEHLRHSLRYTLRQDEIENVSNTASRFIQAEQGEVLTSLVGQTLTYDLRDTRFLPSEGYILQFEQDIAGLGGDNKFLRHEIAASWYHSLAKDWVLNLSGRGGIINGFGGEGVRLSDRFFLGGDSLRGFRFAGLGPRDTTTDDALGGNTFITASAELRFPLGLPDDLRVFGRVFTDVGTLTDLDISGPEIADSGDLRGSAGIGVSWLSPLGPIALDWAVPYAEDAGDQTESFRISFGTRF